MDEEISIEIVTEEPKEVNERVEKTRKMLLRCNDRLEEAFAFVDIFMGQPALCLAIHRNLSNMADTLAIIRFLSVTVSGMLDELEESLELCLGFLEEHTKLDDIHNDNNNNTEINNDEVDNDMELDTEDIINKLAFMNKLMHLNQHSFQIRLLLECSEHKRIGDENGQELYLQSEALKLLPFKANGTLRPPKKRRSTQKDMKIKVDVVIKNSHHDQYAYGPLSPPKWFIRECRQAEWEDFNLQLKQKEEDRPDVPTILLITGPKGVGKSSYAKMIAQRIHSHLEYHCIFNCEPYQTQKKDILPDSETIIRSLLSEMQLGGLSSNEVTRAFQTLMWKAKGIILLENVVNFEQISKVVPLRGRCVMIITCSTSIPNLFKLRSKACVVHQRLAHPTVEYLPLFLKTSSEAIVSKSEIDLLYKICDGYSFGIELMINIQKLVGTTWSKLLNRFQYRIDEHEDEFFNLTDRVNYSKLLQRVFYFAFSMMSQDVQILFALVHIFDGPFNMQMCSEVFQTGVDIVSEDMTQLYQLGFLKPTTSSTHRRRSTVTAVVRNGSEPGPLNPSAFFQLELLVQEFSYKVYTYLYKKKTLIVPIERLQNNFINFIGKKLKNWRLQMEQQNSVQRVSNWREFDQSTRHIQKALGILQQLPNPSKEIIQELCEPHPCYTIRFSAKCRADIYKFFFTAINSKTEESIYRVANCYRELADAYAQLGYYEKAIPCYQQEHSYALKLISSEELRLQLIATSLRGIAVSSESLGHPDDALDNCENCRKELESTGTDSASLCSLLLYTANLHMRMGLLEESSQLCDESVAMCLRLLNTSLDAIIGRSSSGISIKEPSESKVEVNTDSSSSNLLQPLSTNKRKHRITPSISVAMSEWSPFPSTLHSPFSKDHLDGNKQKNLMKLLGQGLFSSGDCFIRRHILDKAKEKLEAATYIAEVNDDAKTYALSLRALEKVHDEMGHLYKAHCFREKLDQLIKNCELPLF